jgi:hypothetical protein
VPLFEAIFVATSMRMPTTAVNIKIKTDFSSANLIHYADGKDGLARTTLVSRPIGGWLH